MDPDSLIIEADVQLRKAQTAFTDGQALLSAILMGVAMLLGLTLSFSFVVGYWALLLTPVSFYLGTRTVSQARENERLQRELWNAHDKLLRVVLVALERARSTEAPAVEKILN